MRHLVRTEASGLMRQPTVVAELGPGASLGVGIAALLTGADRYIALDVVQHATPRDNVQVFDELVDLLAAQEPIPSPDEFPEVRPGLNSFVFPHSILDAGRLNRCLATDRVADLRRRLTSGFIPYLTPWDDPAVIDARSVDMVVSQAVMEHVNDLAHTYAAIFQWLRPGGVMSHQVDFRSHGTSGLWNGHWRYSDRRWRIVRGDAGINRQPLSSHLAAIQRAGFEIATCEIEPRSDGVDRNQLDPAWRTLSDEDLHAAGAYVQAVRPK